MKRVEKVISDHILKIEKNGLKVLYTMKSNSIVLIKVFNNT